MNWLRRPRVRRALLGAVGTGLTVSALARNFHSSAEVSMRSPLDAHSAAKTGFLVDQKAMAKKRSGLAFKTREQHLKEIESTPEFDVLVIGGGCVGAGVTLNTSAAGLKTLVFDAYDFGSGTSSKSTKLLHGGTII